VLFRLPGWVELSRGYRSSDLLSEVAVRLIRLESAAVSQHGVHDDGEARRGASAIHVLRVVDRLAIRRGQVPLVA